MLSEMRQTQKDKYCMFPCNRKYLEQADSQRQKEVQWLPGAGGRGEWGVNCLMDTEFQFGKMKNVLEMDQW